MANISNIVLYHISFEEKEDTVWIPRKPYEDYIETEEDIKNKDVESSGFGEPSFHRICCSENLAGCFMGVYPNVSKYFEEKEYNYPHIDFFFYSPILKNINKDKDLLTPQQLTSKRYVWDAHVTKEWNVLVPVKLILVGKVRFFNTTKTNPWITTHPFNDNSLKEESVSPQVKYKILQWKKNVTQNDSKPLSSTW